MKQIDYVTNTGLTPINLEPYTEHGGGGFKKVVAVVAAVAIPIAAPAIASSIGLSAAIGSVMGSAIVGAGLGAVSGAITGQNIGRSALLGGLSAGAAGYFRPGTSTVGGRTFQNTPFSGSEFRPDAGYSTAFADGYYGSPDALILNEGTGEYFTQDGTLVENPNIRPELKGPDTFIDGGGQTDQILNANQTPVYGQSQGGIMKANLQTTPYKVPDSIVTDTFKGGAGAKDTPFFGDNLFGQTASEIGSRFTNPEALADVSIQAGINVLGSTLFGVGEPSDEEKALLNEQKAQLEELKKNNREAYDFAMSQAKKFLGLADDYDPTQKARQAYTQSMNRAAALKRDNLRKISYNNPGLRAAERRRYDLGASANAASAYDRGMIAGLDTQAGLYQKASSLYPKTGGYNAALTGLQQSYANLAKKRSDAQAGLNQMFGAFGVSGGKGNDEQYRYGLRDAYNDMFKSV
tara:strand:+ start:1883 stop:3271 length:1389 start_codon:yes stop_codon:yes gene_type:complete